MPMPGPSDNLERVKRLLGQDPRKVAILGTLIALLGLLIVRQITNAGPVAQASGAARTAAPADGAPADPGRENRASAATAGDPDGPVGRWLASAPTPLSRNPFLVKLDLFPPDVTRPQLPEESGGFWDEVAKSLLDHADQQERKQELLSRLQEHAKALRVTSVLMGPKPRAVINGELVGEGDVVAGFRVLEIGPRRVVIEREGIRLEVTMN